MAHNGTVTTLAGSGSAGFADGQGTAAHFNLPDDVAVDGEGTVFVADTHNHRIRKITAQGAVTTLAGSGSEGFADGQGTAAHFNCPDGIAVDGEGTVFVSDQTRIRKITAQGTVTTLAGSGSEGFADGQGTAAHFNGPWGIAVDGKGTVFVADFCKHRIRKITAQGTVTTLAGSGSEGFADGQGTAAHFNGPWGIAVAPNGDVLVADNHNHCIRRVTAGAVPLAFAREIPSSHAADMRRLLADPVLSDVTFVVDGQRIAAHRCVLATRGEYFCTLLTGPFREGTDQVAEISVEETTVGGFRALLEYLYTDKLDFEDGALLDLMSLAHRYQVERVYNHLLRRCLMEIETSNAVRWFIDAHKYGLKELRTLSFAFIVCNFRRIKIEAKETLTQLAPHPKLMMEVVMEAM